MTITPTQAQKVLARATLLHSAAEVDAALDQMAARITTLLGNAAPLVLVVVNGGIIPAGMLLPRLAFPLEIDYLHATRYRGDTRGGALDWIARPRTPLGGRDVLVLDDILDEGLTLKAVLADCRAQGARRVFSAVLIDKRHDRKHGMTADIVGLEVADRYLFGCGMDYKGYHRQLPAIYAADEQDA